MLPLVVQDAYRSLLRRGKIGTGLDQIIADAMADLVADGEIGTGAGQLLEGNKAYESLVAASKIGAGAAQVSGGDHVHAGMVTSAYADLVAESKIGAGAAQVSQGDHAHLYTLEGGQYLQDKKAQNNSGGDFNSGAWRTRDMNDAPQSIAGGVGLSLGSNQITLLAGFYIIRGSAPGHQCATHQARLQNITDAVTAILGTVEHSHVTYPSTSRSIISGIVGIGATKVFELQHWCTTTRAIDGFGRKMNVGDEIYSKLEIIKLRN